MYFLLGIVKMRGNPYAPLAQADQDIVLLQFFEYASDIFTGKGENGGTVVILQRAGDSITLLL